MLSTGQVYENLCPQGFNYIYFSFYSIGRCSIRKELFVIKILGPNSKDYFLPGIICYFGIKSLGNFYFKAICIDEIISIFFSNF